jgi:hypothetical protein
MHGELIKIACNMVCSTRICIPIVVGSTNGYKSGSTRLKTGIVLIPVPALLGGVTDLRTHLTLMPGRIVGIARPPARLV